MSELEIAIAEYKAATQKSKTLWENYDKARLQFREDDAAASAVSKAARERLEALLGFPVA